MTNRKWNWLRNDVHQQSGLLPAQHSVAGQNAPVTYFGPMSQFFREMDRMFENVFQNFGAPALMNNMAEMQGMMFRPHIDITSNDNEYAINVEVPGIDEKDIRIALSADGTLTISGEKRLENEDKSHNYHRLERSYGSFQRTLSLPEDAEQDSVEANFRNGVLTITAHKTESSRKEARRIDINTTNDNSRTGNRSVNRTETRPESRSEASAANATHPKRAA